MSDLMSLDSIGDLIATIGSPSFGSQYFELFRGALQIDQCTVFAFKGAERPNPLILESKSAEIAALSRKLAHDYVAGAFRQDPNVRRGWNYETPTVHCLRAREIENPAYRLHFYDQPSITSELVVLGQTEDTLYYSSFYRADRQPSFEQRDVDLVSGFAKLAIKALHRHFALLGAPESAETAWMGGAAGEREPLSPTRRAAMLKHLTEVLLAEPYTLSPREAEVCAAIILGYTTLGISLNFGISVNTVATHRKRAYHKLGICSQSELFSRYFQAAQQRGSGLPEIAAAPGLLRC